jgi:acetyltransferase-like isoleucine patch superfamily enzyme|nr:acyltransferase [uncultured Acetatifactor sp.]
MNIITKIRNVYEKEYNKIIFMHKGIKMPSSLVIHGKIAISGVKSPCISFGKNIHINSSFYSNPAGGVRAGTLLGIYEGAILSIGNNTGISNSTIICRESITIGDNVNIGVNTIIYDTDMHSVDYENRIAVPDQNIKISPVVIDDGAWIGGHCIILKGVYIGKRSVIAAGSVVTHDIPDDELWGGNPCKFIRKINHEFD